MLEQIVNRRSVPDRRLKRFSLRYPDRRRGFARRQTRGGAAGVAYSRMLAIYRSNPWMLGLVLIAVAMLNVVDLVLTLRALDRGAAEMNPIMAALIDKDLLLASAFKVTIGLGVVGVMWAMRRYRRVLEASLVLCAGFVLLFAYSLSLAATLPG